MIHQVFLDALSHNFFKMSEVNLLIVDECHHTVGKSSYVQIFDGHYKPLKVKYDDGSTDSSSFVLQFLFNFI